MSELESKRMRLSRVVLAAAVTSLLTMPTLAEQPIKGAFGITLGDRLPSSIVDDGLSPSNKADGYVASDPQAKAFHEEPSWYVSLILLSRKRLSQSKDVHLTTHIPIFTRIDATPYR